MEAVRPAMTPEQIEALQNVIVYLADDEQKDFEAQDNPDNHIYLSIQVLEKYLEQESK